ncbi:hypothetical protein [Streptococcus parauberis]|nr:hypothetical protein [Streptococcus parauberis]
MALEVLLGGAASQAAKDISDIVAIDQSTSLFFICISSFNKIDM